MTISKYYIGYGVNFFVEISIIKFRDIDNNLCTKLWEADILIIRGF